MKKLFILFLVVVFTDSLQADNVERLNIYQQQRVLNNGISFVENGIRFRVFLNGDFSFDNRRVRNNRRRNRIIVNRDFLGRIRRVGNVNIGYDIRGNVRRIGTIRIRYRRGRLTRVGNLKIVYNRRGNFTFYGRVRYNDFYANNYIYDDTSITYEFNHPLFFSRNFVNTFRHVREDADYIYYKANQDTNEVKKGTIIKRKRKESKTDIRKRKGEPTLNTRSRN